MFWITALLGLASIVSPFLFGYSTNETAMWTSIVIGGILLVASFFEGLARDQENWEYWVAAFVGLAAVAAPFVLGFSALTDAMVTTVAIGLIALIAAGTKLTSGKTLLQ